MSLVSPATVALAVDPLVGPAFGAGSKIIFQHLALWSLKRVHRWWSGKVVVLLGPPRAGKTSLMYGLLHGILIEKGTTDQTLRPVRRKTVPIIRVGREGGLTLMIKAPWDMPGKDRAEITDQIEYVARYKPHCAVIVVPERSPNGDPAIEASGAWLSTFHSELSNLLHRNVRVAKNLGAIVLVMNMWEQFDKEIDADKARRKDFEAAIKAPLEDLQNALTSHPAYNGAQTVPIIPCVLVQSKHEEYVADVVVRIALLLST